MQSEFHKLVDGFIHGSGSGIGSGSGTRRQDLPRRRYSDGPVTNAEHILAHATGSKDTFVEAPTEGGTCPGTHAMSSSSSSSHGGQTNPHRRRFSDGPLNRAEILVGHAHLGMHDDDDDDEQQHRGNQRYASSAVARGGNGGPHHRRRRHSDGPLDQADAMASAASDSALYGDDWADTRGELFGGMAQSPQPSRRRRRRRRQSGGPRDRAKATLAAASSGLSGGGGDDDDDDDDCGLGALEPLRNGMVPQHPSSAPPSAHAFRCRANSDGVVANSESLLVAGGLTGGFDPDDDDEIDEGEEEPGDVGLDVDVDEKDEGEDEVSSGEGGVGIEPMPHPQDAAWQRGNSDRSLNRHRAGRRTQLRRSNSDGVISQAESLMAAAAGFGDDPELFLMQHHHHHQQQQKFGQGYHQNLHHHQHHFQRHGGQMPKRRYSDGIVPNADALLAAADFEPVDLSGDCDQKMPSRGDGGGGGRHRRSSSDDPVAKADALVAKAAYNDLESGGGGGGGGGDRGIGAGDSSLGGTAHQDEPSDLGMEGQLHQLTLMQQMALQGLLTPSQMAALHNLQVQMHLQHSGLGLSSMTASQPKRVKSAMKSGTTMSPGPVQQQQQQQQQKQQGQEGFDMSGFEPTSIQDMVARESGASPVQSSPDSSSAVCIAGMGMGGGGGNGDGVAMGGITINMSGGVGGGIGGIMAMKRDMIDAGKNMGARSAACVSNKKKSWKKPKDKPKRPLSAYNLFFQKERERMVQEAKAADAAAIAAGLKDPNKIERNPSGRRSRKVHGIGFASMAQSIASKWKSLDASEKKEFEDQAAVERTRYRKELDEWKKAKREKTLIQQRAELREIQERRRMEEQAALAAQQGGQMLLQFGQIEQMRGAQQMMFHEQMLAQQQQQQMVGMTLGQMGMVQAQMQLQMQMQTAQMQMHQSQQHPSMPVSDESEFYMSMFEHLSRDDAGNIGNVAAAAAMAAAAGNAGEGGLHRMDAGSRAHTPPPLMVQIASRGAMNSANLAADRVLSHGGSGLSNHHRLHLSDRQGVDKVLTQRPAEGVNMCSFQMSDLSLDLAAQDPAVRPRR